MKLPLLLSITLFVKLIAAAAIPSIMESSSTPANASIIPRDVNYAHGICHFHAQVIQNCCARNLVSSPKHASYVDIFSITDGKGIAIPGLGGDMVTRKELHKCGARETGPVKTITGMEKTMEYEWIEFEQDGIPRMKMTYRYGDCHWDEGLGGFGGTTPGSQTGYCPEYKPWCSRGDWSAGGVCKIAGHPYRRTHDMDCAFAC